jgi:hypothetical protein
LNNLTNLDINLENSDCNNLNQLSQSLTEFKNLKSLKLNLQFNKLGDDKVIIMIRFLKKIFIYLNF